MSDKELAVQLYIATLQANAALMSHPNFQGTVRIPDNAEMVRAIADLTRQLSEIKA